MNRRELQRASQKRGKGVTINPSLCFYNPREVYVALTENENVRKWSEFISNHYSPPCAKVLLIYPCSADKPYSSSRSYRKLYDTLSNLGESRNNVHVVTVSEPFALVPEEFYMKKTEWHDWKDDWYDCPGLFEWWCGLNEQPYDRELLEKCIAILASHVASFLKKVKGSWPEQRIVAYVRTYSSGLKKRHDHTHTRILEEAERTSGVKMEILPSKRLVASIVSRRGRQAWDLYGAAHPVAQKYLLSYLRRLLSKGTR